MHPGRRLLLTEPSLRGYDARVARWQDVRRIALMLPETVERSSHDHKAWCVRDKSLAWERPLRPADVAALAVLTGPFPLSS